MEFKCGRMDWDGRMVTADKRKGKIVLFTSEDEQLTHFQWHDRGSNQMVTDLIVINDAYFERVAKCTTGRVYILRFTSSDKKLFFWMQEPKEDGDKDLIKKFNEAVGAKIPEKSTGGAGAAAGAGGAAGAAAAAAAGGNLDPQLQAALAQILESHGGGAGAGAARAPPLPMNAVLTPDLMQSLMEDETAVAELMQHVPEGHRDRDGLRSALGSPQLQQSLRTLTQAVHSDQLPLLFSSLNLDPSAIASAPPGSDAMEILCRAMERSLNPGGGSS